MSQKTAKKFVKYLWSITLSLLPYDGSAQPPPITAHDINYAISYHNSLIKRGKAVARLLAVTHFNPLTRTYPDDDISFLCSKPDADYDKDTISADDGPFRHSAIGMIICRMLTFDSKGDICISSHLDSVPASNVDVPSESIFRQLRFALDEFNTGSYLKLSFKEWAEDYSWNHVEQLWDSAKELQGGDYLDGVQRRLAEQLR
ncbi:hypothetical protein FRC00_005451 [Tulasnella sp. 408]|nr:hypothetical protein FRC00_005451 [Tulasnella sp. 408]